MVWCSIQLRKHYSWALSLPAGSVVSSSSHNFVLFPSVSVQFFGLLDSCTSASSVLLHMDYCTSTYGGVDRLGVFPLFLKMV